MLIERIYFQYEYTDNVGYKRSQEYVLRVEEAIDGHREELDIRMVYSFFMDNHAATTLYFNDKYLSRDQLKEKRTRLREIIPEMAGVKFRLGEDGGGSSGGATQMEVSLFGEDRQTLAELAEEVKRRFSYLDGMTDVKTSIEDGTEQIQISLDQDLVSRYSLTSQSVADIMNLTFRGMQLSRYQAEDREVPMFISLDPADRVGLYNLHNLLVGMVDDKEVTLGSIAEFEETRGPTTIVRQDQKTTVSVQGLYEGEDFGELKGEVSEVMNSLQMPLGYSWSFSQRLQARDSQKSQMGINAFLAVICVYMLMAALFESFLHPLVIMVCLPLAGIGVIWALLLTGTAFGMMAMIGTVILIGVVVNNGIVLIDHVNNFRKEGMPIEEALIEGGRERFRPIVMTAATTVLGLVPMAIGNAHVGNAQYYPLARAVMGGLISSTFLTLLALPTYYLLAERMRHSAARLWIRARDSRRAVPAADSRS
jgi:HAE1 family hydrophobic/amphiphilic exporter-1